MKYILFNPLSNNNHGEETLKDLLLKLEGEYETKSVISLDYKALVKSLNKDDEIVLVGGDGTINRFINELDGVCPKNNVYLFKAGTGNDFLNDIQPQEELVLLNKYIVNLPKVTVKGKTYRFLNGVGFGIDGYCCEVADELKKKSNKKINYTGIAIKGILFHFKNRIAKVTVDGVTTEYKNCWLAPVMNGRFYGGGMMVAPSQDRLKEDKVLTTMTYCTKSRLKALMVFPSIFKGEHIKHNKVVALKEGKSFEIEFDKPCALQIDGETILDVKSYKVEL